MDLQGCIWGNSARKENMADIAPPSINELTYGVQRPLPLPRLASIQGNSIRSHWLGCLPVTLLALAVNTACVGEGETRGMEPELGQTSSALNVADRDSSLLQDRSALPLIDSPGVSAPSSQQMVDDKSRPSFAELMARYTRFDLNRDGFAEITSLESLFAQPEPYTVQPQGVIIVFVDPRLVVDDPAIAMSRFEMLLWLGQLSNDLFKDGYYPYFVEANVYSGPVHQDGRTLLAMRRFLQDVWHNYPLSATLLVGSFPDASIVRSVFVKANASPSAPENFTSGGVPLTGYSGHFLALDAEFITPRAEIVLGDLDGNWEALYRQGPFAFTGYHVHTGLPSSSYPFSGETVQTATYTALPREFQDAFFIVDHQVSTSASGSQLSLHISNLQEPSPEATPGDLLQPNRIARPEIAVGRLNARSIAVMPSAPPDLDGKGPLDAAGLPQKLRYHSSTSVTWQRSGSLERRLIADYLARSHRFRLGDDHDRPFRTSAIRGPDNGLTSPGDFNDLLRRAHDDFEDSTAVDDATSVSYVNWLRRPAVLRGIAAHSDPVNSQFHSLRFPLELELATGGNDFVTGSHVWRWVGQQQGPDWVLAPSFEGMKVDANFHVYRTLWETKMLTGAGQTFIVHDGCEVMRPENAENVPYDDPSYGQANDQGGVANGESLMFYANGLGLMARNKVFNDIPMGFYAAVKTSGRFGYGWPAYFREEASNELLDERAVDPTKVDDEGDSDRRWRTLQRKRSYFWNLIGDPTLKIRY
jgi:hypothetical protein